MPNLASIKKQMAEVQKALREELCTCGKTGGTPVLNIDIIRTCTQDREREARKPRERCPAMHPDGDDVPLDLSISFAFCGDVACDCHKAPDHDGCLTCDPDYFIRRNVVTAPRVDEPQDLVPARPETPARDIVATMHQSVPALPAPAKGQPVALYGRDPAYLPDCRCGHRAALHREVSMEAVCVRCGQPDGDHAHEDVLVLSGPRPCSFRHPFPGCSIVDPSGPCRCRAYQEAA